MLCYVVMLECAKGGGPGGRNGRLKGGQAQGPPKYATAFDSPYAISYYGSPLEPNIYL